MKIAVLILGVGLALLTRTQARVWTSEFALWDQARTVSPTKPRVLLNLAVMLERRGDLEAAWALYPQVIVAAADARRAPQANMFSIMAARSNQARLLLHGGAVREAGVLLDRVLAVAPNFAIAHFNRGRVFERLGECAAATKEWQTAARLLKTLEVPPCPAGS